MGLTKTEIFTEAQNQLAAIAKVLGHPARIAILQQVFETDTCVCGDLVESIGLAQPTISQHLKELKNAGIIKGTVEGTRVCYCLDTEKWLVIKEAFMAFLNTDTSTKLSCCSTD